MPRSVFMGRIVGPDEPLWLPEDRAWAMALAEVEADTCQGCGQSLSQSMDAKREELWRAEVVKCHGCATAARHVEGWQKSGGDARGAHVRVSKRENLPWSTAP